MSNGVIIVNMKTLGYRPFVNQLIMVGDGLSVTTTGLLRAFIPPGHFLKGMCYENLRKNNSRITS